MLVRFIDQWTFNANEALASPATNGFTYSCSAGSAVRWQAISAVSGSGATWTVTASYSAGLSAAAGTNDSPVLLSHTHTGDAVTVTAAASTISDLAGNTMTAPATSDAANAVIFGSLLCLSICLNVRSDNAELVVSFERAGASPTNSALIWTLSSNQLISGSPDPSAFNYSGSSMGFTTAVSGSSPTQVTIPARLTLTSPVSQQLDDHSDAH